MKPSGHTLYVQVIKNGFNVFNAHTDKNVCVSASTPFASERLAIANFELAAETLTKACAQTYPPKRVMGLRSANYCVHPASW